MQCAGHSPITIAESPMAMIPAAMGHTIAPIKTTDNFEFRFIHITLCTHAHTIHTTPKVRKMKAIL